MAYEKGREEVKLEKNANKPNLGELGMTTDLVEEKRVVCLNDVVTLDLIFAEDDKVEITVKLIAGDPYNLDAEINVISTNSPLGAAIFGQEAKSIVKFTANGENRRAQIKEFKDNVVVEKKPEKVKKIKFN